MILIAVNLDNPNETVSTEIGEVQVRIGRKPEKLPGEQIDLLRLPWNDRLVSRNHCIATCEDDKLVVQRLPALPGRKRPNGFYTNVPTAQRSSLDEPLRLAAGQSFIIGNKGTTAFYWLESSDQLDDLLSGYRDQVEIEKADFEKNEPRSLPQHYDQIEQLDDYSLRLQLRLLQRDLPEQVLSGWSNERELFTRAAVFLEKALPGQKGVEVAFLSVESKADSIAFHLLNPDPNKRTDFRPSRTLLGQLNLSKPSAADIHVWTSDRDGESFQTQSNRGRRIDWVVAIPVAPLDESADIVHDTEGRPIYLYVETRQATDFSAGSFIPFLRLIASLVASLISAREKQRIQDQMSAYFSPALREVMQEGDQSALEPSMVDCSVLFADRRGHSRILERARSDGEILDQLRENQGVVGTITQKVFDHEGVITDFAGDGALALWGWPMWVDQDQDHARFAVGAAVDIVRALADQAVFEEDHGRLMSPVRIGVSTGRLAVGKTGPSQQWHLSVFGSVANLGARLERIAKEFKVPILLAGETVDRLGDDYGDHPLRKLCLIKPAGFQGSYPIFELVLPREFGGSGVTRQQIDTYEEALENFLGRKWDTCMNILDTLSADDPAADWLRRKCRRFSSRPPDENWEGDIASLSK